MSLPANMVVSTIKSSDLAALVLKMHGREDQLLKILYSAVGAKAGWCIQGTWETSEEQQIFDVLQASMMMNPTVTRD